MQPVFDFFCPVVLYGFKLSQAFLAQATSFPDVTTLRGNLGQAILSYCNELWVPLRTILVSEYFVEGCGGSIELLVFKVE
jgi:hypothetical protein